MNQGEASDTAVSESSVSNHVAASQPMTSTRTSSTQIVDAAPPSAGTTNSIGTSTSTQNPNASIAGSGTMTTRSSTVTSNGSSTGSSNNHCKFCMLAEFDIDRGSTLSYQYPNPTGYDEHMLAELMLPDGAHARSEDWTFFFLKPPKPTSDQGQNDSDTDKQDKDWSSKDLTYVINLVRTKHDNTVRRGALVKAMAIGTRHPFIEIFKPALLLALDDYFKDPGEECLARLYDAVNRLDLSPAPKLNRAEKLVLRASDRRDLLEERFVSTSKDEDEAGARSIRPVPTPTSATNPVADRSTTSLASGDVEMVRQRSDSTSTFSSETKSIKKKLSAASLRPVLGARRGSSANSMTNGMPGERRPTISSTSPSPASGRPKDTHFYDTVLTYRSISLPIRVPLTTFQEEIGEYSLIKLIQTFSGPQSMPSGPTHPHLHTNGPTTHPIILLFNALITQKRVIFLGHGQPANQVASFVLAACALGSGCGAVLNGFAARAFPYTNLLNLDDLEKVPGYIAGVTNPRFEDLHAWDVLLNVENGRIQVAKDIASASPAPQPVAPGARASTLPRDGFSHQSLSSISGSSANLSHEHKATPDSETTQFGVLPAAGGVHAPGGKVSSLGGGRDRSNTAHVDNRPDAANTVFMEELHGAIASHYGERYIRARVTEYVFNFVTGVARHEEHFYGHTSMGSTCQPFLNGQLGSGPVYPDRETEMREILSNQMRVEGFRASIAYKMLAEELRTYGGYTRAIQNFDVAHQIGRLRRAKQLALGESDLIFETIANTVVMQDQITELLALLPPHIGGLLPLGMGLFHPEPKVRDAVVDFFLRLCRHPIGRKFVQSMHTYQRLAFARLAQERAEALQYGEGLTLRDQSEMHDATDRSVSLGASTADTSLASTSYTVSASSPMNESLPDRSKPAYHPFQSFSPTRGDPSTSMSNGILDARNSDFSANGPHANHHSPTINTGWT